MSQQILLQEIGPDGEMKVLGYQVLKAGVLAFLSAVPGFVIPMEANSAEKESEAANAEFKAWGDWQDPAWPRRCLGSPNRMGRASASASLAGGAFG